MTVAELSAEVGRRADARNGEVAAGVAAVTTHFYGLRKQCRYWRLWFGAAGSPGRSRSLTRYVFLMMRQRREPQCGRCEACAAYFVSGA